MLCQEHWSSKNILPLSAWIIQNISSLGALDLARKFPNSVQKTGPSQQMRARTVQIIWHDKQAIFSVDFNPSNSKVFCTSGGDNIVNEWELVADQVVHKQSLTRHTSNVNVVRYSKSGLLATSGDDGIVLIWKQIDLGEFKVHKVLRVNSDVYDLSWSGNGDVIVTGSVDGCVKVFNVNQRIVVS